MDERGAKLILRLLLYIDELKTRVANHGCGMGDYLCGTCIIELETAHRLETILRGDQDQPVPPARPGA